MWVEQQYKMKKFAIILLVGTVTGASAFATANNCGTGGTNAPSGVTNPTSAATLTTLNTGDNSDLGTNEGCQVINKVFDNFSTSSSTVNGSTVISLWGTDPATNGIQQNLHFTSASAWSNTGESSYNLYFDVTPVGGSGSLGPVGLGILTTSNFSGSDDITIRVRICFNTTLVCSGTANYDDNFIFTPGNLVASLDAFNSLQTDPFTVRVTLTLDNNTGGSALGLTGWYMEFYDTPEPSTFGMLGSALVGLGYVAHRRRRHRA